MSDIWGSCRLDEERDFLQAMGNLPPVADLDTEMTWVAAHPAMVRKDRQLEEDAGPVLVTRRDILQAPHGPAPSRRAVHSLQHWCNYPRDFHKAILAEYQQSKKTTPALADKVAQERARLDRERMKWEQRQKALVEKIEQAKDKEREALEDELREAQGQLASLGGQWTNADDGIADAEQIMREFL